MSQFSRLEGIPAQRLKDLVDMAGSRISVVDEKSEWPAAHNICKWQNEDMIKEIRGFKPTGMDVTPIRKGVKPYGINHRKQKGYHP